jgi:hypothetical protein
MIDLGTSVGRQQAFGLIASKCSAADAECLKQIRESKRYKSVATHCEEFCLRYLGLSRSHAAYFGFRKSSVFRRKPTGRETIPISQENSERIADVVALLRQDPEELSAQLVNALVSDSASIAMPTEQRRKLRAVRKRLDDCFTPLETIGGSEVLPSDHAEMVSLIAYGLERLNQLPRAA